MQDNTPAESAPQLANPLLDFSGMPRFADIKPEHVEPAIRGLIDENRALIERLTATRAAEIAAQRAAQFAGHRRGLAAGDAHALERKTRRLAQAVAATGQGHGGQQGEGSAAVHVRPPR